MAWEFDTNILLVAFNSAGSTLRFLIMNGIGLLGKSIFLIRFSFTKIESNIDFGGARMTGGHR